MQVHPKNKLYDREIKIYFYLAKVGFEPTPTSTAAPSNTETTVIPTRPLRSLKKELSRPHGPPYPTGNAEKTSINLGHDNSICICETNESP